MVSVWYHFISITAVVPVSEAKV